MLVALFSFGFALSAISINAASYDYGVSCNDKTTSGIHMLLMIHAILNQYLVIQEMEQVLLH